MTVVLFIFWGMIAYLACRVSYAQGRASKWQEISREYLCLHKSVLIKREWETNLPKKHLTKHHKKCTINHPTSKHKK